MFYKHFDIKKNKFVWVENPNVNIAVEIKDPSVVDLSKWSPSLDSVKQLQLVLSGTSNIKKYDYDDGVDTHSPNYLLRNNGLDITEREAILRGIFARNQEESQSELDSEVQKLKNESSADSSDSSSSESNSE